MHRDVVCADCGFVFSCDAAIRPIRPRAVCPNCGYANNNMESLPDLDGDRVLIDRSSFHFRRPLRWEIVAFRHAQEAGKIVIKRVVGLPGDKLQMRDGRLWINGRALPLREVGTGGAEEGPGSSLPGFAREVPKYIETLPNGREHPIYKWEWNGHLDNTPVFDVPAGHVFMMGDNRDDSADSRVPLEEGGFGFVPVGNLAGQAFIVVGSVDYLNADTIFGWIGQFRLSRVLSLVR